MNAEVLINGSLLQTSFAVSRFLSFRKPEKPEKINGNLEIMSFADGHRC